MNEQQQDGVEQIDVAAFAEQIQADRLARLLSWAKYAKWVGISFSTLYKIGHGRIARPHDITVAKLRKKMAEPIGPIDAAGE